MKLPSILRRQTTANPVATVCHLCPSWFYGLTRRRSRVKLDEHLATVHGR